MTTIEVEPGLHVPLKCDGPSGAGIDPRPCTEPSSLTRCQLCPASPDYWRRCERPAIGRRAA